MLNAINFQFREFKKPWIKFEVEIRAHTIYAADLLCKEINEIRKDKITTNKVDEYLWLKGKRSKRPHHFTITIHY